VHVLIVLNSALRRQRRRLAVAAVMLGLAGAVVAAHSAMVHDHMGGMGGTGDAVVMCLALAETAVAAVGIALAMGPWLRRPRRPAPRLPDGEPRFIPAPAGVPARAGPPLLQVFRL
jgi:hypothetical protein